MTTFTDYKPPRHDPKVFDPRSKRASKRPWIKFELANPKECKLLIVKDKRARVGTITDELEIEMMTRRAAHAPDGRLVGIFMPAGTLHSPGHKVRALNGDGSPKSNAAGEPEYHEIPECWVEIPASVAVQRQKLGDSDEQNIGWVFDGQVHRLLLTFDSLKNVELFDMANKRDGIPAHRIATQNPNWKPPEDVVSKRKKPSPQRKILLPLIALLLCSLFGLRSFAADLSPAQLTTLKTAIQADDAFNAFEANPTSDGAFDVAAAFNLPAAQDFWVWRTFVPDAEIYETTTADGTTWSWTIFIARSQGERDAWRQMVNMKGGINAALPNVRTGIADIFSGAGGSGQRTHLLTIGRRKTTRAEKLYATGTGTTATPGLLVFEGSVNFQDVLNAMSQP